MTSQKGNNEMKNGIVVDKYGTKFHYKDDELHKEDGPAVIYANGIVEYRIEGKRHREEGPAVVHLDAKEEYWIDGKKHRENAPAVIRADCVLEYWINGERVDVYRPDSFCFETNSREEALEWLDSKERPYCREMYLMEINAMWPVKEN